MLERELHVSSRNKATQFRAAQSKSEGRREDVLLEEALEVMKDCFVLCCDGEAWVLTLAI